MVKQIKESRANSTIRLPGERSKENYISAKNSGIVEVKDFVLAELGYSAIHSR